MKVFLMFFFIITSCSAQKKYNDSFVFDSKKVIYTTYYFTDQIYPVNSFYVMINQEENLIKCLKNKYKRPYFLKMPNGLSKQKQEELLLAFVSHITNRTKLIESKFYIISDNQYSGLYRQIFEEQAGRYQGSVMNPVEKEYIKADRTDICKILN